MKYEIVSLNLAEASIYFQSGFVSQRFKNVLPRRRAKRTVISAAPSKSGYIVFFGVFLLMRLSASSLLWLFVCSELLSVVYFV
jgi:hypothetical protein